MRLVVFALAFYLKRDSDGAAGAYDVGDGVSTPVPISQAAAHYTPKARDAKVEGAVWLSAVVLADGTVSDVKVTRIAPP